MAYRKCFVPTCKNDTKNSPNKIFVRIREDLREKWCHQVKAEYFKVYTMYCCEDHLEPKEDLINYYQCKLMKQEPKMKRSAILRNIAQDNTENSSTLMKLLLQDKSTRKPLVQKYEGGMTSTSDAMMSSLPIKPSTPTGSTVSAKTNMKMEDGSSNSHDQKIQLCLESTKEKFQAGSSEIQTAAAIKSLGIFYPTTKPKESVMILKIYVYKMHLSSSRTCLQYLSNKTAFTYKETIERLCAKCEGVCEVTIEFWSEVKAYKK